ncbi:YbhB/YbcL family Raf kinase inhibitor-like protein [Deinococcus sonorensis]|uniref:YbhB/YbcL family Raf kinase inhibitor-like protein n=2 Tax=Deinococcus sonorensis TaxID=309891 RepID=A0AAU7UAX0_9DEIO
MNTRTLLTAVLSAGLLASCAPALTGPTAATPGRLNVAQPAPTVPAGTLTVFSNSFRNGGPISLAQVGSDCGGGNISPALSWTGAPAGTVSFVVTAYDPDAPTGSGFRHWTVYNLPATTTSLPAGAGSTGGSLPAGAVQGVNDAGTTAYLGPCPPPGEPHRYIFTVYALNKTLDLPTGASQAIVGFNLNGITLAKASTTGLYGR